MTHSMENEKRQRIFVQMLEAAFPVVCQRLTHRYGDPQLAEEVSWDCLTLAYELWRSNPGYFDQRDLTAWSRQRAGWRALDRLRERGRFLPLSVENGTGEVGELVSTTHLESREDEETQRILRDRELTWQSIRQLEPEDRAILEGYYYEGLTDQEIGMTWYGQEGSDQARGLRIWRRRKKAEERLRMLVEKNGLDPADYAPLGFQAV